MGNGLVVFPAAAGTDHETMRTAEDVKLNAHRTHRWRDKHFGMVSLITQPINQLLRPEIALASVCFSVQQFRSFVLVRSQEDVKDDPEPAKH